MTVNGTCHHCRSSSVPVTSTSPMIFAIGPGIDLSSDDLDARIRRHTAYGPPSPLSLPQIFPTSSPQLTNYQAISQWTSSSPPVQAA